MNNWNGIQSRNLRINPTVQTWKMVKIKYYTKIGLSRWLQRSLSIWYHSSKGSVSSLIKEDIELKGFTVGEDTLTFVDVENGTVTTETPKMK